GGAARVRPSRGARRGRHHARPADPAVSGERWPRGPGSLAGVRPEGETRVGPWERWPRGPGSLAGDRGERRPRGPGSLGGATRVVAVWLALVVALPRTRGGGGRRT